MSGTWVIANQKGGVGKTTTVISLGGVAAARGRHVLMIDLDPHGSLSSYFGLEAKASDDRDLSELFVAGAKGNPAELDRYVRETAFENLSVVPSSISLATVERRFARTPGAGMTIDHALAPLRDRYDLILIDCPPILGMLLVNGIAAADMVVIPVQTDPLALVGLRRLSETLNIMDRNRSAPHKRFVVPTFFDRRTRASWDTLMKLKQGWRDDLWWEVIPVDTQLREASRRGVPVSALGAAARSAAAYERLYLDLLDFDQREPLHTTLRAKAG